MNSSNPENTAKKEVVILCDLENLWFAAVKDGLLNQQNGRNILLAIASSLEQKARELGKVKRRLGAISISNIGNRRSLPRTQQIMWNSLPLLVGLGYSFILVPQGEDAADNEIVMIGSTLIKESGAEICILGTGDGKKPFTTLLDMLIDMKKVIHVVSYNYIPASVKMMEEKVSHSIIAGDVRGTLEELFPPDEEEEITETEPPYEIYTQTARESVPISTQAKESPAPGSENHIPTIRESVRMFSQNQENPAIDSRYISWIKESIKILSKESIKTASLARTIPGTEKEKDQEETEPEKIEDKKLLKERRWRAEFGNLLNVLQRGWGMSQIQPAPNREGLTQLLKGVLELTDLFEKGSLYIFNPLSRLVVEEENGIDKP